MTTKTPEQLFLEAALAEHGQAVSAGGPPLRQSSHARFLAAAEREGGEEITAGGNPTVEESIEEPSSMEANSSN